MNYHKMPARPMGAVELLRKDHARLLQLFIDFFAARSESRRHDLAATLCAAVTSHWALEAEIFYPQLGRVIGDEGLAIRAGTEYQAVKHFVEELAHPDPGDDAFSASVHRLSALVANHIRATERPGGPFAAAELSNMDGAAVASLLRERRREWMLGLRARP